MRHALQQLTLDIALFTRQKIAIKLNLGFLLFLAKEAQNMK